MNKKNYILNNTNTRYFDYFFFKKLAGGANPAPTIEGEGTNFTLVTESNMNITQFRSKGDIYQTTYSGKNLYQAIGQTNAGLTGTLQADGKLKITGTATGSSSNITTAMATNLPAGTYTLSLTKALPFRVLMRASNNQNIWVIEPGRTSVTVTTTVTLTSIWVWFYLLVSGTTYNETVGFQLESGSTATAFEPYVGGTASPNPDYPQDINVVTGTQTVTITNGTSTQSYTITLGSLELCKIGSCQDYIYKDGDDWYVHKAIGKISSYNGETITTDYISTTGVLTNGATVYYCLTTPTDTKITDATLIADLNKILTDGYLKKGTNTISVTSAGTNLPSIIYIKAVGSGDDGNLLTEPTEFTANGVTWTWNKFDAKGSGVYNANGGKMTDVLPLKETLEVGSKCRFSIKEPLTYGLRITLTGTTSLRIALPARQTSAEGTVTGSSGSLTDFQIFNLAQRGTVIDDTIKGFKLEKVS